MSEQTSTVGVVVSTNIEITEEDVNEITEFSKTALTKALDAGQTSGILYIRNNLVAISWKVETDEIAPHFDVE